MEDDLINKTLRPMVSRLLGLVNYNAKHELLDLIRRIENGGHQTPSMEEILDILKDCVDGIGAQCQDCLEFEEQIVGLEELVCRLEDKIEEYKEILYDHELL